MRDCMIRYVPYLGVVRRGLLPALPLARQFVLELPRPGQRLVLLGHGLLRGEHAPHEVAHVVLQEESTPASASRTNLHAIRQHIRSFGRRAHLVLALPLLLHPRLLLLHRLQQPLRPAALS